MGGTGSTRWNWVSTKSTVEDALTLRMKNIHSLLQPGYSGIVSWSKDGKLIARMRLQVLGSEGAPESVRLAYIVNGQELESLVHLTSTPLPWNGLRYWFICPNIYCRRRVATLHLPARSQYFACRHCYDLTYRSCRQNNTLNRFLRGLDSEQDDLVEHPDPYGNYLSADELCHMSGLTRNELHFLDEYRLLVPDHAEKYRPKLVQWAKKLSYLLSHGWQLAEIKRWAVERFQTEDPKQWPPDLQRWR